MTTGKPRRIGLDIGDKRIGIAISDPFGLTAAGLETITRHSIDEDIEKLADIAKRHSAIEIIIGLPTAADGTEIEHTSKIMSFGKRLARETGLPIIYEEERLSSISAIRTLAISDDRIGQSREISDMQAAAIILQKHIDRNEPPPSA